MSTIKVNRFENTSGTAYGAVLQVVNYQTGTLSTGTTTIPNDNTIPQNTEGTEFMTLAITPKSAANKLKIVVTAVISISTGQVGCVALFQDSTANAIAAVSNSVVAVNSQTITFTHYMTSGTTGSTTFKVRIGPGAAATVSFNGIGGTQVLGGVCASSITIEEIQV